jgi:signal transduction histidine kinase
MSHLLDEVIAEAEVAAAAGGREVGFAAATSPSDAYGYADRGRLHQVLTNLLDNAVRHSPDGGKILVTGRSDDNGLTIEVADGGPGISPEERTRVFERFTRGDRASGGGTGLGLAIARWIVELHHGDIAVVEPPFHSGQHGCTIRVTIPGELPRTPSRGAVV